MFTCLWNCCRGYYSMVFKFKSLKLILKCGFKSVEQCDTIIILIDPQHEKGIFCLTYINLGNLFIHLSTSDWCAAWFTFLIWVFDLEDGPYPHTEIKPSTSQETIANSPLPQACWLLDSVCWSLILFLVCCNPTLSELWPFDLPNKKHQCYSATHKEYSVPKIRCYILE